jgi:hypothetical protein
MLACVPSLAWADDSALVTRARQRVEQVLVKPLANAEGRHFSRERPPPRERRVRIQESAKAIDKSGHEFVPFAIDGRFASGQWSENDVVGCVYGASGDVFVKIGDSYRPAAFLLGKNVQPVPSVCQSGSPPARS